MEEIGIRELKNRASDILRKVRTLKEPVAVTYRGSVVANIVPVEQPKETDQAKATKIWAAMDQLAEEISAQWPAGVSVADAVREQRRDS